jgi:hypothetical protein
MNEMRRVATLEINHRYATESALRAKPGLKRPGQIHKPAKRAGRYAAYASANKQD